MENLDKPARNQRLYGFLCIFGVQYMCGEYSSWSLVSILNYVRTDLWLSRTSNSEKYVRLHIGFTGNGLSPSSSAKMLT